MKIATPTITDFDKEDIAPWSGNRLIELHMATLPSKIIKPFIFMPTNKHSLYYQKLRPRFEPMNEVTQAPCSPLCQEGWYFDCETETCKEYSHYECVSTYINTVLLQYEELVYVSPTYNSITYHNDERLCPSDIQISNFFNYLPGSESTAIFNLTTRAGHGHGTVTGSSGANLPVKTVYSGKFSSDGELLYDGPASITTLADYAVYTSECDLVNVIIGIIEAKHSYNIKVYGVK